MPTMVIDEAVMRELRNGNEALYEQLYGDCKNYIYKMASKYSICADDFQEKVSCGNLGFVKAVQTFDPNRGVGFLTYAAHAIKGEMFRANKPSNDVSLETPVTDNMSLKDVLPDNTLMDFLFDEELSQNLRQAMSRVLDGYQEDKKKIIGYILSGHTQMEVCRELYISQSSISRTYNKFVAEVSRELDRLGI